MSKNEITISSIVNLPEFDIFGLSRDESNYIRYICMSLLNESRLRNNSNEVGIYVDCFTFKTTNWHYGSENEVNMYIDWKKVVKDSTIDEHINRYISIHNHPSNSTFSMRDIYNFLANRFVFCKIVLCPNSSVHIVTKMCETSILDAEWFETYVPNISEFKRVCKSRSNFVDYRIYRRKQDER